MAGRPPVSIDGVLDQSKRNTFANTDPRLNPSIIGTKGSERSAYVGNSLSVASSSLRHSSIAGENAASVSQPRKKKALDPSDPSTWTSSSNSRPRAASETQRVEAPEMDIRKERQNEPVFEEEESKRMVPIPEVVVKPAPSQTQDTAQTVAVPSTIYSAVTQAPESPQQANKLSPISSPSKGDGDPSRRFSNQTSSFSTVDSDQVTRIEDNDIKGDEHALQESSDEERSSSDMDTSSPVRERGRKRDADIERGDSSPESTKSEPPSAPEIRGKSCTSILIVSKYLTMDLVDEVDDLSPYHSVHSGKLSQTTGKVTPRSNFRAPSPAALSNLGDDDAELKRAKAMELRVSPLDETIKDRTVKMIIRGDWNAFQDDDEEDLPSRHEPRLYLLGSDLSSEATYALEWTIGTLLKDGDTILIVNAVEDEHATKTAEFEEPSLEIKLESAKAAEEANTTMGTLTRQTTNQQSDDKYEESKKKKLNAIATHARSLSRSGPARSKTDSDRITSVDKLETDFLRFVRKTTLQVRCMIEVINCRSPRHLILNAVSLYHPK